MGSIKFMSVLAGALGGAVLVLAFTSDNHNQTQVLAILAVAFAVLSLHEK
jgi:hypothetical protein